MHILLALAFLLSFSEEAPTDKPKGPEAFSPPKYYKRVDDGEAVKKQIKHDGSGFFVRAVRIDKSRKTDTLQIYIQGIVKGEVKPDYQKSSEADVVIWCFPSTYPDSRHLFPNARGRIVIHEKKNRLVIATENFIESLEASKFESLSGG